MNVVCEPRWATRRRPERPTFGPQIAAVAEKLGQPLMPWQMQVAYVGGELIPYEDEIEAYHGILVPAYRGVGFTVPRQSGKTLLNLSWEVQRGVGWPHLGPQRIIYSAQTGNDARKKLIEDQIPILEPRKARIGIKRILKGMGNEAVEFRNGSRMSLLSSSEESGHGPTLDLGVKDEFFADTDDRRDQAMIPAMNTRPAAQTVTSSTAGTEESIPLNRLVERGRRAVEKGVTLGTAYFEWSAGEDDDVEDENLWPKWMPALGHTIGLAAIRHARDDLTASEFRRAYGNLKTTADDRVIPAPLWEAVVKSDAVPAGSFVFALDMNPERSAGAIACASRVDHPVIELVESRQGTGWMVSRAVELARKWKAPIGIDEKGPAGSLIADLKAQGVMVVELGDRTPSRACVVPIGGPDMVKACGGFFDAVIEAELLIRRHADLDTAVAAAVKQTVGDAWKWARKSTQENVSPLVAATLAWYLAKQLPVAKPRVVDLAAALRAAEEARQQN